MKDEKGFLSIVDAMLAVLLLFIAISITASLINTPSPLYSQDTLEFKDSQDLMETLSGKVNFTDKTFLEEISEILENGGNSRQAILEVSRLAKNKFQELGLTGNYQFREENIGVLASSGDLNSADNVTVASRSYGDYRYFLYTWA